MARALAHGGAGKLTLAEHHHKLYFNSHCHFFGGATLTLGGSGGAFFSGLGFWRGMGGGAPAALRKLCMVWLLKLGGFLGTGGATAGLGVVDLLS